MPGAKELFGTVHGKYGSRCEILTGVPRKERGIVTAEEDKIAWVRRLLSENVVIHTVRRKQKIDYCQGPGDILIDDLEKTIDEWRGKGGTGILHRSAEKTLAALKDLGVL